MKFGGTSVGDASCMERVVEIIREAARDSELAVVVSAMSGVTNKLVGAANYAAAGDEKSVAAIFEELRQQHNAAAEELIDSTYERRRIQLKIEALFQSGERRCQDTVQLGELALPSRDAITSLGERLSVLLVSAALNQRGVASEAIDATELIVTNAAHGSADPCMERTRQRCEARLRPMLQRGIVPVITGFIGATPEGVLTTLGRGGSDYSATILAASLESEEVLIWTDVDGMHTADPRVVPEAVAISEISYSEAAVLASFGAKVLHPKTLRALEECGIPLWIRNTFTPELPGTKITPESPRATEGVKAVTAISDVVLVTLTGHAVTQALDVSERVLGILAADRIEVLTRLQAFSHNEFRFVISSAFAERAIEILKREFAPELARDATEIILSDSTIALVTVVGRKISSISGIVDGACEVLAEENVNMIATARGLAECSVSFVVDKKDASLALSVLHREFRLAESHLRAFAKDEGYLPDCHPRPNESHSRE
jgi:aspartate kinase